MEAFDRLERATALYSSPRLAVVQTVAYTCVAARMVTKNHDFDLRRNFERGQDLRAAGEVYSGWFGGIAGNELGLIPSRSILGLSDPGCDVLPGQRVLLFGEEKILDREYYIVKVLNEDRYHEQAILARFFTLLRKESATDIADIAPEEAGALLASYDGTH